MKCKVVGCGRDAQYKQAQLCQKHYFRVWRYGTTETVRVGKAKPRAENPAGYQWIYNPTHPLRHKSSGYVAEHRAVLYAAIGDGPIACAMCSKPLTWKTCHVDHIDNNVRNNELSNLRPACSTCNTRRGMRNPVEWSRTHKIEFAGERKTPHEWSRDPRVAVSSHAILQRKRNGATDEEALFAPKATHNGNRPVKKPAPPKHTRSNAINATVGGVTKTSMEWSRDPRCQVSDGTIRARIKAGWKHEDAVFAPARAKLQDTYRRQARELEKQIG